MNNSSDLKISISPEKWVAMLRKAGAPQPWADPNAAERFATAITFQWPAAEPRTRNAYDRASDAIAELRRVLPEIIAADEGFVAALDAPPPDFQRPMVAIARFGMKRELCDLRRLSAALPELHWELGKSRTPPWQVDAARLHTLYLRHINHNAGISADGPLVRFIVLAIRRMRSQTVESLAVAKALQRVRDRKRRTLDKSGMA